MRAPLLCLALAAAVHAVDAPLELRLLTLEDGLPAKLEKSPVYKTARDSGIDLRDPPHPIVVAAYGNGRLFHVFYKSTENAFGDRPYLIQRMKRVRRYWKTADAEPEETVEYKVEVFKTIAGALKSPDEHHGSYGIGDYHRREVIKEYEIGFGEIPGVCEGKLWPFDKGSLFRLFQNWSEQPGLHAQVKFHASREWRLEVAFDRAGNYRVASPELGFDIHAQVPPAEAMRPRPNEASRKIVLEEGKGLKGVVIGVGTEKEVIAALGEPLERVKSKAGNVNLSFANSLTVNLKPDGKVNTIFSRAGFAGRTSKGASHESTRSGIRELYGEPDSSKGDFVRYDGVVFYFDGFGKVRRIVIHDQ